MSLQINNDAQSFFSTLQLNKSQAAMAKSLARLATGRQIQSAADDVSGLTISDQLQSDMQAFNQSIQNANDSISTVQLADGALGQASEILQGVREKTLQAANASQSPESRQAIQSEIDKSLSSLHGIIDNTTFNGRKIFGDIFSGLNLGSGDSSAQGQGKAGASLQGLDVTTPEGAQLALKTTDTALGQIDGYRSDFGSRQNQLTSTVNSLRNGLVNTAAAESKIGDVDLAEEALVLSQTKLLNKAQTFAATQTGRINAVSIMNLLQG